jgi:hypothetical protein
MSMGHEFRYRWKNKPIRTLISNSLRKPDRTLMLRRVEGRHMQGQGERICMDQNL